MTIGYFPGCSLAGTSKEYDRSLRAVLAALDVDLQEIDDWSCCGASSAHATSHLLSVALPARILALARAQGMAEVLAPCAACHNRLRAAREEIERRPGMRGRIEDVFEEPWNGGAESISILDLFARIGGETVAGRVRVSLSGIRAACYYGCLLVRPASLMHGNDAEHPRAMEAVVRATGAVPVDWRYRTECCGAAHSIARRDIVVDLSKKIIDDARAAGADVIVVACPMCHSNLDMRQLAIRKLHRSHESMPVLYLSELIGVAFGIDRRSLGLDLHMVDPSGVIAKAGKEAVAA